MNKKAIKAIIICGALVMSVVTVTIYATSGQSAGGSGGGRIAGTWNVRVDITNCQNGAVIRSFDSVGSFHQGGTMIDSTSGIRQELKTPGHGVWSHTSGNRYSFRFKSFSFDPAGTYTGYTIIQHEADLDASGDEYSSEGTAEIYTPNGALVGTGCSATTATRFSL